MPLVPHRFLFRVAYPCRYVKDIPREEGDSLLDLPADCALDNFAAMDGQHNFAEVRLAWNELGLGVQVEVRGKSQPPQGDIARPRASDGVTLWIDTRDARTSHRASRHCHQFHFLPSGGGPDHDEPVFTQTKIHRALQDAPFASAAAVPFRCHRERNGYVVEAFLPATVLNGFDPEQSRRLGVCYAVRDTELGEQMLGVDAEFPFVEDPSLWSVLELIS
ncbi:MAG: hypothetical protein HYS12_18490 [Planctomycetes bacterium]|nr:hypothetical protein [Planctomycetota bacterium]